MIYSNKIIKEGYRKSIAECDDKVWQEKEEILGDDEFIKEDQKSAEALAKESYKSMLKTLAELEDEYDRADNNPYTQTKIAMEIDSLSDAIEDYKKKWGSVLDETLKEDYTFIDGHKVRVFYDLDKAKKEAEKLGLKESEYGDIFNSKYSYCCFNKTGNRNDDEDIYVIYKFEKGKAIALNDEEIEEVNRKYDLDLDNTDESLKESRDIEYSSDDEIIVYDIDNQEIERFIEQDDFENYTDEEIVDEITNNMGKDVTIKRVSYDEENLPINYTILYDKDYMYTDESLKEKWFHITYEDGSMPYIVQDNKTLYRLKKQYGNRMIKVSDFEYEVISDIKKDKFIPSSTDESLKENTNKKDELKSLQRDLEELTKQKAELDKQLIQTHDDNGKMVVFRKIKPLLKRIEATKNKINTIKTLRSGKEGIAEDIKKDIQKSIDKNDKLSTDDQEAKLDKINKIRDDFYGDIDNIDDSADKSMEDYIKSLKEEYGYYKNEPYCEEIANDLEDGLIFGNVDGVKWELEVDGKILSEDDSSDAVMDFLTHEISFPVRDGHLYYGNLNIIFSFDNNYYNLSKEDLLYIGFNAKDIKKGVGEIETWISYDTNFDVDEWEEQYNRDNLPTELTYDFHTFVDDDIDINSDDYNIEEDIGEKLLDDYGYGVSDFDYNIDKEEGDVYIYNIKWDINESLSEIAPEIKSNIIEFPNGEVLYIDYEDGKLFAGSETNAGVMKEIEIDYDDELSIDQNLQILYDKIIENKPELLDENIKSLKESSVQQDSFELADGRKVNLGWDKNDGFYVDIISKSTSGDGLYTTDKRKTFKDEEVAKRYFKHTIKKLNKQTSHNLEEEWTYLNYANSQEEDILRKLISKHNCEITASAFGKFRIDGKFDDIHKIRHIWQNYQFNGILEEDKIADTLGFNSKVYKQKVNSELGYEIWKENPFKKPLDIGNGKVLISMENITDGASGFQWFTQKDINNMELLGTYEEYIHKK